MTYDDFKILVTENICRAVTYEGIDAGANTSIRTTVDRVTLKQDLIPEDAGPATIPQTVGSVVYTEDDVGDKVIQSVEVGTPPLNTKVLRVWDLDSNTWCSLNMDYTLVTIAE